MSKSRSGDSQGSRSSSVEAEEHCMPEPLQQSELNQLALESTESIASAECTQMTADTSSVVSINTESTLPASSPPPSYERVVEETRLARSETEEDEEAVSEEPTPPPKKGQEILYKSSKNFYRAMAKQWGITCKMSDNCRCLDCQSHYFDCGYEKYQDYDKYYEQSDGGLSATTPMFVSEVMQGSACLLL